MEWNEEAFSKMSQKEKDKYVEKMLKNSNNSKELPYYLNERQLKRRKREEVPLYSKSMSKREQASAFKSGLELEF